MGVTQNKTNNSLSLEVACASPVNIMKYEELKNKTYRKYKKIGKIYCPYLKTDVNFTGKGFWHLIYTSRNKKRNKRSQELRFQLLEQLVKVIKITTTLQEYETKDPIQYYAFIAIIEGWKIKIIVKKVGSGRPYFWSVIPNWTTNKKRDRLLHKGNLEKD